MTNHDMLVELLAIALRGNPDQWHRSAEERQAKSISAAQTKSPMLRL